ncbi:MAG: CsiV family protein [Pseudomonadales bacterium]
MTPQPYPHHPSARARPLPGLLMLTIGLVAGVLATPAVAAESDAADAIRGMLHDDYYEIEFFVFERPSVMDFNTEETLATDRPRALPRNIRTQRLDPAAPWTGPIDPLTRLCLTFPTVTWKLAEAGAGPVIEEGEPVEAGVPVPGISPQLEPDPQLDFLAAVAEYERDLQARSGQWQPADRFVLAREASRIRRTGLGRILFHGRWLEAPPPRDAPEPILIEGGEALTVPYRARELVGSVGVTLGRYLHFSATLFLHGPGFGLMPAGAAMAEDGSAVLQSRQLPGPRYMVLSESRRMRSGETHYLDHPKLGVVVRIDPVALPVDLIESYESLEEGAQ